MVLDVVMTFSLASLSCKLSNIAAHVIRIALMMKKTASRANPPSRSEVVDMCAKIRRYIELMSDIKPHFNAIRSLSSNKFRAMKSVFLP